MAYETLPEVLTVHSTDHSVIAVGEGDRPYRYFFHSDCEPECIVEHVKIAPRVPYSQKREIIANLLAHGTNLQVYADGYTAYSALNRIRA